MSAAPVAAPVGPGFRGVERHGTFVRVVLVTVGAVVATAGASMLALVLSDVWQGGPGLDLLPGAVIVLLFGALVAYGVSLVVRGVRGRSRVPFAGAQARADRWHRRHAYACGLVGWGVLAGAGMWGSGEPAAFLLQGGSPSRLAWHVFLFLAVLPFHVALHELGHAAAGGLVGFRFSSLRVGSLVVGRDAGRLRVTWSPLNVPGLFGLQHAIADGEEALGARLAFRIAAGPVTTLLAAAACRAGALAQEPALTLASVVWSDVLRVAWWAGAFFGIVNLLPFRTRAGLVSDGAQLLAAVLPRSPGAMAVARATMLSAQGRRPREWGVSATALLEAAETAPRSRDALLVFALGVALDSGDGAGADAILRRAAAAPPSHPLERHEIELQAAMVEALRGEVATARTRLAALGPHPMMPAYPKLAEAVVHLAEGDAARARAALDAWNRALAGSGVGTSLRVGNEWAEEALRARLVAAADREA